MIIVYYNLIRKQKLTIEDVPLKWREQVSQMLNKDNEDKR